MNESKSNFNQAFWLGISSTSSMLVSILSAAILSRFFDKAEYGTYKQIIFVYTTLLVIFEAGLPSVFSYFLPKYSHEEGKYIVKKVNRILFLMGFLLSATLFLTADLIANFLSNPELAKGLKIFSPFPIFTLPTIGIEGVYIVNHNTKFVAIYNTVTRLLMLICIVLPVVFIKNTYETAVYGWGVASFLAFVFAMIYMNKPYHDVHTVTKVEGLMREVWCYSMPILGSSCVLLFYNSINQIVISRYFGVEAFAEFSNGFMPLPFIAIIVAPIRKMLVPMYSKSQNDNTISETIKFMNKAIYEMGLIIIPMVVFCFCFSKNIMIFVYGEQYASSYIFFMISLIFNYFEIFPMQTVLAGLGKTKLLFSLDVIFTVVLVAINSVLILFSLSSPIIVAAVFVAVQILLRYIVPYLYLLIHTKTSFVEKVSLLRVVYVTTHVAIVACITLLVSTVCSTITPIIQLLISGICYYVILILSGLIFKFDYLSSLRRLFLKN